MDTHFAACAASAARGPGRVSRSLARPTAAFAFAICCAACGGDKIAAPVATTVVVNQSTASIDGLGATTQLSATVEDQHGAPIPTATVTWSTSAANVATVSTAGLVTAVAQGTATITVADGSASATTVVTVVQTPAAMVKVTGDQQTAQVSTALANALVVQINDVKGNAIPGVNVSFSIASGGGTLSAGATVTDAKGQASSNWTLGNTGGTQSVTASAGSLSATFSATATGGQIGLSSIDTDTLVEGASVTLNGFGFSTIPANDTVKIDGVPAQVTAASATQLTATVPSFDCLPARDGGTTVTVGTATSNAIVKRIHPAAFVELGVGAQQVIQTPSDYCLQFRASASGGDGYLVGVGAAAESPSTQFPVTISTGTGASLSRMAARPVPLADLSRAQPAASPRIPTAVEREVSESWSRQYAAEVRLREWERQHMRSLRRATRPGSALLNALPAIHGAPPAVGDTMRVSVIDASQSNLCTGGTSILTRVKAVGTAGIWVTDVNNPGPDSLTDAEIRAYSDTFDLKIYASDTANFGAPSDIDGNQRVVIVMTIAVNKEASGSLAGFVFGGDLFPQTSCATSNVGEYFYGNVPDPGNVAGTGARSHAAISFQLPSLIAHEFTHDIQDARRLVLANGVGMNAWEAEGQAMMAQELVGHDVLGNGAGNNYDYTFLQTGNGGQAPRWYRQGFDLLGAYFGSKYATAGKNANAPAQCSLYASTNTANIACFNFAFYGASWSFQRYIADRFGATYPGGTTQLTRDVISKNVGLSGRANWQALLGLSAAGFDSVYAQWAGMLYVDDRVTGAAPALTLSSWNLTDIFNHLSSDARLTPLVRTFSAFSDSRTVNGGGTAYTTISSSGAHPALAVKVRGSGGAILPTSMHPVLWIVRLQ